MIRAVVFDVDDTLYLERDYVRSGLRAVGQLASRTWGVDGVAETAWRLFTRGVRGTTITDSLMLCGMQVTPEVRAQAISTYREHVPDIALLRDARDLLDALAGTRLGVITDGPAVSQRRKCCALGIEARMATVLITDEHGRSKPDPWCFQYVEAQLGASGGDLVYVADNPLKDFTAPLARGWHTLRVRRPRSLHVGAPAPDGVREASDLQACAEAVRTRGLQGLTDYLASPS